MDRKHRSHLIGEILELHFPNPQIPLVHHNPFTLLVAVCLSAQCTDERVNLVTPELFKLAPTPQMMCNLDLEKLILIIRPCGLAKSKASRLLRMSWQLLERHNGVVPQTFEALEALDGVGHKTASVVMAQAFGQAAFPVDTHIFRCARRWGLSKKTTVDGVEEDLKKIFPKNRWSLLHLQMILFARKYCPARIHKASLCPICCVLNG